MTISALLLTVALANPQQAMSAAQQKANDAVRRAEVDRGGNRI
jgi:hypothetical protein